jgi:hypothetical protein
MHKAIKKKVFSLLNILLIFALAAVIGACGGSTDSEAPVDTSGQAASLILAASKPTVPSNNSESITITVSALDSSSAFVANVNIQMSTDTGILGSSLITTDTTGKATVTFEAGNDPTNRTATITAATGTGGTVTAIIPIQIVGSTVTMTKSGSTLPDDGTSPVDLTITVRKSAETTDIASGVTVTMTHTGGGAVTFTPASGPTNTSGVFTTKAAGTAAGNVTVTASALGATATTTLTVSAVAETFAIDQQMLNSVIIENDTTTAMKMNTDTLNIRVNAPTGVTNITFATSIGEWNLTGNKVISVAVSGGKASANLTSTQAGVASVMVYNTANPATNDSLTVAMSSGAAAHRIDLQASPTKVPVSVGDTTGSATLTATVYDIANNPRGGLPVLFTIINPSSGGENVSPVVAVTAEEPSGGLSLGQARTSFTSGSLPSGAEGIQIRASVIDTTVETEPVGINVTDSGNDVAITIGGAAGSIAFGQATVIGELDPATYSWPMSVLVADSGGNPVQGAVITLSVWPIAWSTGVNFPCAYDADDGISEGTFFNEDINENLILDAGEDGKRTYYSGTFGGTDATDPSTVDTLITPVNTDGGTLPSTVTTDANGVATFNLNYPKQNAIWTKVRIRATTIVQGSSTRGEINLRLTCTTNDCGSTCRLQCPYVF